MDDAELEEEEQEEPQEEAAAETEAEPEDEDVDLDAPPTVDADDVTGPDGKILGKFKDVSSLAKSYKNLESTFGRKSGEASEYRKALESAGWTFDAAGKAIPPAAPQEAKPEAAAPDPSAPDKDGNRVVDGVLTDYLGLPVMSADDWAAIRDEDPDNYIALYTQYNVQRALRQKEFEADQSKKQTEAQQSIRLRVREEALKLPRHSEAFVDSVLAEAEADVAKLPPNVRDRPEAFQMAAAMLLAQKQPAHYEQIIQDLLDGKEGAVAAARAATERGAKVIGLERGAEDAAPTPKASSQDNHFGLTADERTAAKSLGVSEEAYAKNK